MKRLLARKMLNPFGVNANLASLARGYYWTAGVVMILAMLIALLEGVGVSLLIPLLSTLRDIAETNDCLSSVRSFCFS